MTLLGERRFRIAAAAVVAALLVALAVVLAAPPTMKHATAYFGQTVNLYPQDRIRVLGVEVGQVTDVVPEGDQVRVDFEYEDDVTLPAEATAAVLNPSLVGVRFVQVGPPHRGGPELAEDAVIPRSRTASPAEWDEIKDQVERLAASLGPTPGSNGSLSRLLDTTDANLGGQGPAIRGAVTDLSRAVTTLSDGRQDLFGTVRNLEVFISALRGADADVSRFQTQLAQVSGVLDANRQDLAQVLAALTESSPVIERFLRDNREQLATDVAKLKDVVANVSANRQGLADILQRGPAAISNFANIVDENSGSVTAALAATNFRDPAAFICDAAAAVAPGGAADPTAANACRAGLGPLLQLARVDVPPIGTNPIVTGQPANARGGN